MADQDIDLTPNSGTYPSASNTITAGNGLSGGGDLSANRTIDIDLNELATETAIAAGDFIAMVDITDNGSGKITFANFEGALNHDNLTGFVANEHIDHTSVTITAGNGLSGGGDISANRTIDLDLNELTTETSIAAGDFLAMVDITDNGSGKITFANLEGALNHDNLTGFVGNEHIDHTSVTLTAGEGLSGGGDISANRTFDLDLNELTTITALAVGDKIPLTDVSDANNNKNITVTDFFEVINAFTADASPDGAADYVVTYDASASTVKRVLLNNLPSGAGGDAWGDPVDADIIPDADGTRDLGATATRFAEIYGDALDITNNIVVGGTVDGRDVATDGTKLDGVESNADVTDSANVASSINGFGTLTAIATGDFLGFIDISDANNGKKITFSNFEGALNHDNLAGFVANEHIDHTSVSITGGNGLSGGGDISANRTIDVDINGTTDLAAPAVGDELLIGDISNANAIRKADVASVVNLADHDALTNFVANEHIDHTSVTLTAGNGLSGGGDISANRTFDLDLNELTTLTAIASGDKIPFTDISDSNNNKNITFANLEAALNHDNLAGYVAAEHINEWSKSISVEDPTSSEDITLFFTSRAITITEIRAVLLGSSTPSVTWTIRHHATDRSNAGNEVVTSGTTTTSTTSGSDVTAFNDATIPADSFVWLETTAQSGTVDELHITIIGTYD